MKATRITPTVAPPPDIITLEMSHGEALLLETIAGYDLTIPEAIYGGDRLKKEREEAEAFLHKLFVTLKSVRKGKP